MRNFTLKSSTLTQFRTTRLALALLLLFASTTMLAQQFHSTSPYMQSSELPTEQYQGPEVGYHSTIYAPFSDETPSTSNTSDAGFNITNRKNEFGKPENENPGTGPTEYPIGEPWIMLAFAAMAAVVITFRKKQTA